MVKLLDQLKGILRIPANPCELDQDTFAHTTHFAAHRAIAQIYQKRFWAALFARGGLRPTRQCSGSSTLWRGLCLGRMEGNFANVVYVKFWVSLASFERNTVFAIIESRSSFANQRIISLNTYIYHASLHSERKSSSGICPLEPHSDPPHKFLIQI